MSWRDWVHVPWHCPYCLITGMMLGQFVVLIVIALCLALARAGMLTR